MGRIAAMFNYKANVEQGSRAVDYGDFRPDGAPRATVDPAQTITDLDALANTATNGIIAAFTGAGGSLAYSTTTHLYTGNTPTSATISQSVGNAMIALLNAVAADVVAAKGAGPADVVLDVNATNVPSWSRLRKIVHSLLDQLRSSMQP